MSNKREIRTREILIWTSSPPLCAATASTRTREKSGQTTMSPGTATRRGSSSRPDVVVHPLRPHT
ncbi:hypothetical protein GYH30_016047 [Glycine max]|uniref:Uncharacterized protein n=1 Tax=Glycine max TaxID=3847 RepID=K7KWX4_SOYBN|nr:hypothetical protein JHK87_016188 [Glycine soja]KAG5046887.1 hypothetical protein JHK86_016293 [Glycine max]KAH1127317.1 hypothetical protein GYH30_016047 [Glycine max]